MCGRYCKNCLCTPLTSQTGFRPPPRQISSPIGYQYAAPVQQQASSTLIPAQSALAHIDADPDSKALSKRIYEVEQAASPYESKDDPELWIQQLLTHAFIHKLHWHNLIDHAKVLYKGTKEAVHGSKRNMERPSHRADR